MAAIGNSSQFFGAPKWVTGTTYAEGFVVWAPSDSQYYMRKNGQTGAGATDPASDTTNWQPTGCRAVKSIQRGLITSGGPATVTATITAVVTAKSELRFLGGSPAAGLGSPILVLTNSTTITASVLGGSGGQVSWELTESY